MTEGTNKTQGNTTDPARPTITAAILAGGRGTRMGGLDKGLVDYRGRPLVEWVIEALRPQVDDLLIVANRSLDEYRRYGIPVHADVVPGFQGPLAGMLTAMRHARSTLVLCAPCDTPHLPGNLVDRLLATMMEHDASMSAPRVGEDLHPVICLQRTALADDLRATLAADKRRVRDWLQANEHVYTDFRDCPRSFDNLNRLEDLLGGPSRTSAL